MKSHIQKSIQASIDVVELEIRALTKVKAAMESLLGARAAVISKAPKEKKSPANALPIAILAALKGGKVMANPEIRKAIGATGYKFSLAPAYVSKTLAKLLESKQLKRLGKGARCKYKLP